jgi:hypothetical protein
MDDWILLAAYSVKWIPGHYPGPKTNSQFGQVVEIRKLARNGVLLRLSQET